MKMTNNTADILAEVNRRASAGLKEVGEIIKPSAKDIVVVVSGDLRDSITAEVSEKELVVGSPLAYAPKIEMDKPFLRLALIQNKEKIRKIFRAK